MWRRGTATTAKAGRAGLAEAEEDDMGRKPGQCCEQPTRICRNGDPNLLPSAKLLLKEGFITVLPHLCSANTSQQVPQAHPNTKRPNASPLHKIFLCSEWEKEANGVLQSPCQQTAEKPHPSSVF